MKNIKLIFTIIFILGFTSINAQSKSVYFITKTSKVFKFKNGYDKNVDVKLLNYLDKGISIKVIRKIAMTVLVKSKYKLKNKLSYVPRKLTLMPDKDTGGNTATVEYLGKNAYGTEGKSTSYFSFTKEGVIEHLFTR